MSRGSFVAFSYRKALCPPESSQTLRLFLFSYGVGSKLGPFAAFSREPTEARNCKTFRELRIRLGLPDGKSAQGISSQTKPLKINEANFATAT